MAPTARGTTRRSPLFGAPAPDVGSQQGQVDEESLERENDKGVSDLGDRVSLLKNITKGIQDEVQDQHGILDRMSLDMSGTRGMLGGTADRLGKVMENSTNSRVMQVVCGLVALCMVLYFLFGR